MDLIEKVLRGKVAAKAGAERLMELHEIPGEMEHAVVLSKARFHSKRLARQWCAQNDWEHDIVEETPVEWRFIQEPATTFASFTTRSVEQGVSVVIGTIKRADPKPQGDPAGVRP